MSQVLRMENISKSFFDVKVLKDVSFDVNENEVHTLLGENGAGKSTLIKVVSGAYSCDSGDIEIAGHTVDTRSYTPRTAEELGVVTVYQNFHLVPHLSVAENISLSDLSTTRLGFLSWKAIYRRAREVLDSVGFPIEPHARVRELAVSQRQMLEVAIAISKNARVLILDEPTAALSRTETETLFEFIRSIRNRGIGIIYISHKLEEIEQIADRVTVLRDGQAVRTFPASEADVETVVNLMTGRDITQLQRAESQVGEETVFEAESINVPGRVREAGFRIREGEILGLTGLVGAGKTELTRAIFGADPTSSGEVSTGRVSLKQGDAPGAVRAGVGYVPEDRDAQGLCMNMTVRANTSLVHLSKFIRMVFSPERERRMVQRFVDQLRIRTAGVGQQVKYLSGGNKQKVVLAKWLTAECQVLILDEPTIGIDVGAREEIYRLVGDFAAEGHGVLFVTSDMDEALRISDRLLVMSRGRIVAELDPATSTKRDVMRYCMSATSATGESDE